MVRGVLRHQVFRASSLRALALAMGIVASVLVSRLGGADVKGVTSAFAATSIVAYTAVNLDLAQQTLRHGRTTDTVDAIRGQLVRIWPWYFGLAAVVAVIGAVAGSTYVVWVAAGALAYLLTGHLAIACTGMSGPAVTAVGGVIQQGGLAVACLVAVALGVLDTRWAPLIVIVSFLSPLPLYFWATRPRGRSRATGTSPPPELATLVRAGVRWQGARLAQVLLLRLDILWVFLVLGAAPAGLYAVGLATAALAGIVPTQFASNTTYEAMHGRRASMRRNTRSAALTGLVAALVLAGVGWPLLVFAYGREFEASYTVMLGTLPGVVAYGVLQVFTNHTRIVGEARAVALPSAAGVIVMIVGLAIGTSEWGILGAALASSAGSLAAVVVAYALTSRSSISAVDAGAAGSPSIE